MSVARNSASNLIAFLVVGLANLAYTPFLVRHLGLEVYGIIPVVMNIFVFATWVSLAINWSVGRYITIEYSQEHSGNVTEIFNTSFWSSALLALVIIAAGSVAAKYVQTLLRIPPGSVKSTQTLILLTSATTAVIILTSAAESAFYCLNRFDYRAALQVGRTFFTILAVWGLFHLIGARLEWIGIGSLAASILMAIVAFVASQRLIPAYRIDIRRFNFKWFKEMFSTNTWIVIDQLGTILMMNINILLANRLFGPGATAQFALASMWEGVAKSVLSSLTVFNPTFVTLYAAKDFKGMRDLTLYSSRFVGALAGLATGILMGHAWAIPRVWLRDPPGLVGPLIAGFCVPVLINAPVFPLFGIMHATNKVKLPSLVTIFSGVVSVLGGILLAKFTRLGLWSLVVSSGIAFTLRNLVFTVYYVAKLTDTTRVGLLKNVGITTSGGLLTAVVGLGLVRAIQPTSWATLIACMTINALIIAPVYFLIIVGSKIKNDILTWLKVRLTSIHL